MLVAIQKVGYNLADDLGQIQGMMCRYGSHVRHHQGNKKEGTSAPEVFLSFFLSRRDKQAFMPPIHTEFQFIFETHPSKNMERNIKPIVVIERLTSTYILYKSIQYIRSLVETIGVPQNVCEQ